jgi:hypothetical protein
MKRSEDVFFFTLIDFLIQISFFGFLLFALDQASREVASNKIKEADKLIEQTGVSSLTELTDYLSKMAPVKELKGVADFISAAGGIEKIKKSVAVVSDHGGVDKVSTGLEKLRKIEEGSGKPPCLFIVQDGKRIPQSIGHVQVTDTRVTFLKNTPELQAVLAKLGTNFADIQDLSLGDFRGRFSGLNRIRPDCRYQVDVSVNTQLLAPMDSIWSTFATRRK